MNPEVIINAESEKRRKLNFSNPLDSAKAAASLPSSKKDYKFAYGRSGVST